MGEGDDPHEAHQALAGADRGQAARGRSVAVGGQRRRRGPVLTVLKADRSQSNGVARLATHATSSRVSFAIEDAHLRGGGMSTSAARAAVPAHQRLRGYEEGSSAVAGQQTARGDKEGAIGHGQASSTAKRRRGGRMRGASGDARRFARPAFRRSDHGFGTLHHAASAAGQVSSSLRLSSPVRRPQSARCQRERRVRAKRDSTLQICVNADQ